MSEPRDWELDPTDGWVCPKCDNGCSPRVWVCPVCFDLPDEDEHVENDKPFNGELPPWRN